MIEFKQKQHSVLPDTAIVEVWVNGEFKAAIYPNKTGNGIRVISRHRPIVTNMDEVGCWEFNFGTAEQPPWAIKKNVLDRWYIASPVSPGLAWSGSAWVPHRNGIPVTTQVCNFESPEEAVAYIDEHFNAFYPPPVS